ncbi:hypothetical protein GBF38_022770 [Nibea albiflora]|uniref:Uncharacterized protein n=1 Tax=Nibea albiflora TaxID=240163 RepID=A0ACB7EYK4_NIBAL|nr:hypothetical protein GBF38_022770 [Nibea albiflora]
MDPAPEGAEEAEGAQVDVAGEEQGTTRSSGGEEEGGGGHMSPPREDQATNQLGGDESDDPYNGDPGRWGNNIDTKVRAYWAKMGPGSCQDKDADLSASEHQDKQQRRFFSQTYISKANSVTESVCPENGRLHLPSWNVLPELPTNPIILRRSRVSVALLDHINITLIEADKPAEPGENQQRAEGFYKV